MKNTLLFRAVFFAFIVALVSACSNAFTKATSVTKVSAFPSAIEKAKKDHRYFLMKSGINAYTVTSVDLDNAKQQMTVTLDKVDSSQIATVADAAKQSNAQKSSSGQIHLYMTDSTSYTLDEPHTIPLVRVARIELLQ